MQIIRDAENGVIIRCKFCTRELITHEKSMNTAMWTAELANWVYIGDRDEFIMLGELSYVCTRCQEGRSALDNAGWYVYCDDCEDEEWLFTKQDAQAWSENHDCRWNGRYESPNVEIEGPVDRRKRAEEVARAEEKYKKEQVYKRALEFRAAAYIEHFPTIERVALARRSWWRRLLLRMAGV